MHILASCDSRAAHSLDSCRNDNNQYMKGFSSQNTDHVIELLALVPCNLSGPFQINH